MNEAIKTYRYRAPRIYSLFFISIFTPSSFLLLADAPRFLTEQSVLKAAYLLFILLFSIIVSIISFWALISACFEKKFIKLTNEYIVIPRLFGRQVTKILYSEITELKEIWFKFHTYFDIKLGSKKISIAYVNMPSKSAYKEFVKLVSERAKVQL